MDEKKLNESGAELTDEQLNEAAGGFGYDFPQPGVVPPPRASGDDDNPPELPPPGPNFSGPNFF